MKHSIAYLEGDRSRVVILNLQDLGDLLSEGAAEAQLSWFNFDRHDFGYSGSVGDRRGERRRVMSSDVWQNQKGKSAQSSKDCVCDLRDFGYCRKCAEDGKGCHKFGGW